MAIDDRDEVGNDLYGSIPDEMYDPAVFNEYIASVYPEYEAERDSLDSLRGLCYERTRKALDEDLQGLIPTLGPMDFYLGGSAVPFGTAAATVAKTPTRMLVKKRVIAKNPVRPGEFQVMEYPAYRSVGGSGPKAPIEAGPVKTRWTRTGLEREANRPEGKRPTKKSREWTKGKTEADTLMGANMLLALALKENQLGNRGWAFPGKVVSDYGKTMEKNGWRIAPNVPDPRKVKSGLAAEVRKQGLNGPRTNLGNLEKSPDWNVHFGLGDYEKGWNLVVPYGEFIY